MLKKKKRKKKETKILSNQRLCFKVSLPYLRSSIVDVISLSIINCSLDLIQIYSKLRTEDIGKVILLKLPDDDNMKIYIFCFRYLSYGQG